MLGTRIPLLQAQTCQPRSFLHTPSLGHQRPHTRQYRVRFFTSFAESSRSTMFTCSALHGTLLRVYTGGYQLAPPGGPQIWNEAAQGSIHMPSHYRNTTPIVPHQTYWNACAQTHVGAGDLPNLKLPLNSDHVDMFARLQVGTPGTSTSIREAPENPFNFCERLLSRLL
jgi:hypothetical protein